MQTQNNLVPVNALVANARDKERERLLGELLHLRNQFNAQLNLIKFKGATLAEVVADGDKVVAALALISSLEDSYKVVSFKLWTLLGLVGRRNQVCLESVTLVDLEELEKTW